MINNASQCEPMLRESKKNQHHMRHSQKTLKFIPATPDPNATPHLQNDQELQEQSNHI
jgi:hypothetical protein